MFTKQVPDCHARPVIELNHFFIYQDLAFSSGLRSTVFQENRVTADINDQVVAGHMTFYDLVRMNHYRLTKPIFTKT